MLVLFFCGSHHALGDILKNKRPASQLPLERCQTGYAADQWLTINKIHTQVDGAEHVTFPTPLLIAAGRQHKTSLPSCRGSVCAFSQTYLGIPWCLRSECWLSKTVSRTAALDAAWKFPFFACSSEKKKKKSKEPSSWEIFHNGKF